MEPNVLAGTYFDWVYKRKPKKARFLLVPTLFLAGSGLIASVSNLNSWAAYQTSASLLWGLLLLFSLFAVWLALSVISLRRAFYLSGRRRALIVVSWGFPRRSKKEYPLDAFSGIVLKNVPWKSNPHQLALAPYTMVLLQKKDGDFVLIDSFPDPKKARDLARELGKAAGLGVSIGRVS